MHPNERRYAELVKGSVPIAGRQSEDMQPDIENCSNGTAPRPNMTADGVQKMTAPVAITMTKYLFKHYRLNMYSYLNSSLRSGKLRDAVGFSFTNRKVNREVCTFRGVNFWRIDRRNFWADVRVSLLLGTESGSWEWRGYLCFWFSAGHSGSLTGTIEELTSEEDAPDRKNMALLSPYLIPYFTSAKMDAEAENLWETYIPGSLADPELRKAQDLARAMGLSIVHLPLHRHKGVSSILFLIDDCALVSESGASSVEVRIPANTIVINTNNVKKEYSDFNIFHECVHYCEHYLFFCLQEMHHDDLLRMKTREIEIPDAGEKVSNPVYWMEKQANRGAYGLMMPVRFMCGLMAEKSQSEHTFNIDRLTAGDLYEKNAGFREVLDSGKFIYADGHIVRNEPRFVEQAPWGHMLTPWAIRHVDQCCLRFTRIYEQENVGRYVFGRMNYDPNYVEQTMFYLEDLINEKEMDEIEAELQYKRRFPETFIEAFDMLMKRNGDTRETMAEKLNMPSRTLLRWLEDPDRRINADFVVTVALLWRLPDWISALLLDRAYIHLSETNRRHLALQYILKVLWSEGVDKANEFLVARKLDPLTI